MAVFYETQQNGIMIVETLITVSLDYMKVFQ